MPRAWPVEIHARCYTDYPSAACDGTGSSRGDSRSLLHRLSNRSLRCHGLGPWRFTLVATLTIQPQLAMPRAWPVEISRSLLHRLSNRSLRCHGLGPWRFTLVATPTIQPQLAMPRAWPVEIHARCYTDYPSAACDATGLARGDSRSLLHRLSIRSLRCHGLGPWRFTLVATPTIQPQLAMPRAWPVEIHARC